jgi:hypothetical protein
MDSVIISDTQSMLTPASANEITESILSEQTKPVMPACHPKQNRLIARAALRRPLRLVPMAFLSFIRQCRSYFSVESHDRGNVNLPRYHGRRYRLE